MKWDEVYSLPLGDRCVHAVSGSGKTEEAIIMTKVMTTTVRIGLGRPFQVAKCFHVHQLLYLPEHQEEIIPGSITLTKKPKLGESKSEVIQLVSG